MSLSGIPEYVGAPSAVYVGLASGSTVLTKFMVQRTEGAVIVENRPVQFVPSLQQYVQAGNHSAQVTLTFLGEDDLAWKIARGIPITGSITDPPDPDTQYCLFLVYADRRFKRSYWFPNLSVISGLDISQSKSKPTTIPITFANEFRDWNQPLIFRGTYTSLITSYITTRSPIPA